MSVFLAVVAVWALLLCLAVAISDGAQSLKRREFWRSIMAGLVGLSSLPSRRLPGDDAE